MPRPQNSVLGLSLVFEDNPEAPISELETDAMLIQQCYATFSQPSDQFIVSRNFKWHRQKRQKQTTLICQY